MHLGAGEWEADDDRGFLQLFERSSTPEVCRRHNFIRHYYTGHNYIRHYYIGHEFIGHHYSRHNYIGGRQYYCVRL